MSLQTLQRTKVKQNINKSTRNGSSLPRGFVFKPESDGRSLSISRNVCPATQSRDGSTRALNGAKVDHAAHCMGNADTIVPLFQTVVGLVISSSAVAGFHPS